MSTNENCCGNGCCGGSNGIIIATDPATGVVRAWAVDDADLD